MKVFLTQWSEESGWNPPIEPVSGDNHHLVFLFGAPELIRQPRFFDEVRNTFRGVRIMGCSTAGEIVGTRVSDNTIVLIYIVFERVFIIGRGVRVEKHEDSRRAGIELIDGLPEEGLRHVFVLSDGMGVNGSELVAGITSRLPGGVTVTGGLSGDGDRFQETWVIDNAPATRNTVSLIGFYGDLQVSYASMGGWDPFGPERLITRSTNNVLYELDGKSALELYKTYLGDYASQLPASGLMFPLNIRWKEHQRGVVRTILAVDETNRSMTFAGDIPEGSHARLMKANLNRIVDGAIGAARLGLENFRPGFPGFALLISCVGRKMILRQRVEEEVEGVSEILGADVPIAGFYSYGEICPFSPDAACELHNQTMTITLFNEGGDDA